MADGANAMEAPVAGRDAKPRALLSAENIRFNVKGKDILQGISLKMYSGETMAIMGPSGAGKTTFMDTLTNEGTGGIRTGRVTLNGESMNNDVFQKHCAYVPQHDTGWPFLRCREVLEFTADFYMKGSRAARKQRVDDLLKTMGLEVCQHTRVGNEFIKGLSGGQKRRLSLASAFLKSPVVIFLDEVTSGLDAAAAAGIARFLQDLAREKDVIIMCTIHQPSAKIFFGFDRLLLLSRGRVAYSGKIQEVAEYFESIGHHVPEHENPADFFMDSVNGDFSDRAAVEAVLDAWDRRVLERQASPTVEVDEVLAEQDAPNCAFRTFVLFRRMLTLSIRDPLVYISRIVVFMMSCMFFSLVYIKSRERTQEQVFNRLWLMMWHMGVPAMMSVAAALSQNQEFVAVRREIKSGMYPLTTYFATQFLVQIPFLFLLSLSAIGLSGYAVGNWNGSVFFSVLVIHAVFLFSFECAAQLFAVTFANPLLGIFSVISFWFAAFLFAGFLVPEEDVIYPLRLFASISPIKWATKAVIHEELIGTLWDGAVIDAEDPRGFSCPGDPEPVACYGRDGAQILITASQISWAHVTHKDEFWQDTGIVFAIAMAMRVLYFMVAAWKCRGGQQVKPPDAGQAAPPALRAGGEQKDDAGV